MVIASAPVRLQVEVKDVEELRERLDVGASGHGRLHVEDADVPIGRTVEVEIHITEDRDTVFLYGTSVPRTAGEAGGVAVHVPDAAIVLDGYEIGLCRRHRRLATGHLALVETRPGERILCCVSDVGEGGARLLLCADDAGPIGSEITVCLLESGARNSDLIVRGRIAWRGTFEAGVCWADLDEDDRSQLARLLRNVDQRRDLALAG